MTLSDYLKNKSVALVCGGAVDEEFIEGCDCVASINMKCLFYDPVDIAYCTGGVVGENFLISKKTTFKYVRHFLGHATPMTEEIERQMEEFYGAHGVDCDTYISGWKHNLYATGWAHELFEEIKTQPLSGVLCLTHLLQYDVRRVGVTGMTFFAKDGLVPFARDVHRMEPQREYIRKLHAQDTRVWLDCECLDALDMPIEELDWHRDGGALVTSVIDPREKKDDRVQES